MCGEAKHREHLGSQRKTLSGTRKHFTYPPTCPSKHLIIGPEIYLLLSMSTALFPSPQPKQPLLLSWTL